MHMRNRDWESYRWAQKSIAQTTQLAARKSVRLDDEEDMAALLAEAQLVAGQSEMRADPLVLDAHLSSGALGGGAEPPGACAGGPFDFD